MPAGGWFAPPLALFLAILRFFMPTTYSPRALIA